MNIKNFEEYWTMKIKYNGKNKWSVGFESTLDLNSLRLKEI